jgi:hypothetical protein
MMSLYLFVGFSPALARVSLLQWMPGPRALLGLGIANAVFLVRFLSRGSGLDLGRSGFLSLFWTSFLLIFGFPLADVLKNVAKWEILLFSLMNGLMVFHMLLRKGSTVVMTLAGISMLTTVWFNPLVSGGTAFLYENPLSRAILETDRREKGATTWAVYGRGSWMMGNLIRALGVRSVSGTHPCPQPALWERLDPGHRFTTQTNRFAHVELIPPGDRGLSFSNPMPDLLIVNADPLDVHRQWGVTHLLVMDRDSCVYDRQSGLTKLLRMGDKHIYRFSSP